MKQNCVPALLGDDYRHPHDGAMIWHRICHVMERELRVHCGLSPKLNKQTFYIVTVICKQISRTANLPGLNGHELELTSRRSSLLTVQ
jgi:hypothetical protein